MGQPTFLLVLCLASAPLLAQEQPAAEKASAETPQSPAFSKLSIDLPQFTEAQVALLPHEIESIAQWLAAYVGNELAQKVLARDPIAKRTARRCLALAFHLAPHHAAPTKVNDLLGEGSAPPPMAQDGDTKKFSTTLLLYAARLQKSAKPQELMLAGFFQMTAADLDPENEDAIVAAETFASTQPDLTSLWKTLIRGRKPLLAPDTEDDSNAKAAKTDSQQK